MTRGDRRTNDGRRMVDTRPSITLPAAVDACNMIAQLEREAAAMRKQWENCFPPVSEVNGAHIGNFYAAKRNGSNGKV